MRKKKKAQPRKSRIRSRGQSVLEFSLVGVVIIVSIVSVPLYIKHGLIERISNRGQDIADGRGIDKTSIALLVTATIDTQENSSIK